MTVSSVSGAGSGLYYSSYTSSNSSGSYDSSSPADIGIDEREEAQANGYNVGTSNITSAQSMLNISDGALSSISDYLQSIRELAIQASNDLLTDDEKQTIQDQIEEYKQGISDISGDTTYNTKNILDGSEEEFQIATDANGNSMTVTISNATLDALGITDFDVTEEFDLSTIDSAIEQVSSSRASGGAQYNALSYASNYASYQATYLKAKADDEELEEMIQQSQKMKREQALQAYRIAMQKNSKEAAEVATTNLFA